ncbi:MAG: hypothetical protein SGILL_009872, partial [Bacillariaceae sp.]
AGNGLFGSDVGIAQEFAFTYQTLVIPSVTVAELNIDMLAALEEDMGNEILMRSLPQCSGDPVITESLAKEMSSQYNSGGGSAPQQQTRSAGNNNDNLATARYNTGTYSNVNPGGRRRQLQMDDVAGFSTRPRDVVDQDAECTNVEPVFPCYVINGRVTVYSSTKLDDETQDAVRSAIRESIENGNLADSDNRFLDVTWGMFVLTPGGGDGPGGPGSPSPTPTPGPNGANDDDIDRADTTGGGLEPWAWALIAVGGALFLALLFFCFRRPRRQVGADAEAADDEEYESSSNKSSSHDSQSQSVEENDVYADEYDEARATPLIQNTSATRLGATGSIEEEDENDLSYEDLKAPDVGASVSSGSGGGSYQDMAPAEYDLSEMSKEMESQDPQKYVGQPAPTEEDSAYSSYEDQVEEEYEIEYLQGSQRSGNWADGQEEYSYEQGSNSDANSNPAADSSLPMLAHTSQQGSGSSFDAMRKKWEN